MEIAVMKKLGEYREKIDALSIRERAMILLAIIAILVFLWESLLIQPLDSRQRQLQAQLEVERAQQAALNRRVQNILAAQNVDPNAANRERLAELRAELALLEGQVRDAATDMIAPARMPEVLRGVINQTSGVTLRQLKGLGASPLMADAGDGDAVTEGTGETDDATNAFKHGMAIHLRGDYLTVLEYLRRLQALEWHFLWDSIEFQVDEYPDSKATLTIYTLSLTRDWIRA